MQQVRIILKPVLVTAIIRPHMPLLLTAEFMHILSSVS